MNIKVKNSMPENISKIVEYFAKKYDSEGKKLFGVSKIILGKPLGSKMTAYEYGFELDCLHNKLAERVFRQLKDRVNLDYTFGIPYDEKGTVLNLMKDILENLHRIGKQHDKKAVLKEFKKFSLMFKKTLNEIDKIKVTK